MIQTSTNIPDGDDTHLAIIRLLSSGVSKRDAMQRLGLSKHAFNKGIKGAVRRLGLYTGLSGEALDAVLAPRLHGSPPKCGYHPRYSGPAITVSRAYDLDVFHDVVDSVSKAQKEWHDFGNDDLARWLSGWRPASHGMSDSIASLVGMMDVDLILYTHPEGLRFEPMLGALNAVDLKVHISDCEGDVLCAALLSDVSDPASSVIFYKNSRVALPLTEAGRLRWECFLRDHRMSSASNVRVRIAQASGPPPNLSFVML